MTEVSLERPSHAAELIRLRWFAIAGQTLLLLATHLLFALQLPLLAVGAILGIEIAFNFAAIRHAARRQPGESEHLGLFMVVDMLILTALLYLTGGPYNPFSFIYLVHIALAALVLDSRGTWLLGLFSIACFGSLFLGHLPLPGPAVMPGGDPMHHHSSEAMDMHVQGMWLAFAIAALAITYFLGRVTRDLDQRNAQLHRAQTKAYRTEKIAALATLATGAAHELATPLSTIAIISKDLESEVKRLAPHPGEPSGELVELVEDARLIRDQVDRCRDILEQLAVDTGQTLGESNQSFALRELIDEAIAMIDTQQRLDIDIADELLETVFLGPQRTLAHALRALIKNAVQASSGDQRVTIQARYRAQTLRFEVIDRGPGIPEASIQRVVEPFYSTKAAGQGVGLGLFLAQSVADTLGGSLELSAAEPRGTRARINLPLRRQVGESAPPPPAPRTTEPEVR
ncbi:ATP-binding protein [Bradymonas sediminis]|uniref:histidine kinase n=1 Tax=Bradymonas sediminis TaxID=1548548 RepID=A0A2Z4FKZ4_9DELT|nr:ATP-binding protein [Bradymonas sediminis]AWV89426.1 sensor histidine kinase [Bradymonas sediminis]TDP73608.1 two-component system sensor histidine kinase RegB [Bradymonas sediminis]